MTPDLPGLESCKDHRFGVTQGAAQSILSAEPSESQSPAAQELERQAGRPRQPGVAPCELSLPFLRAIQRAQYLLD